MTLEQTLAPGPIGIFDSGYGGLTVFRDIQALLPGYDYIYLGDNARAPYGTRDFDSIYRYTWQAVQALFEHGCHLIILACNTSSAQALRHIQKLQLLRGPAHRRVLGVIRPTTEIVGEMSPGGHIGILATESTVASGSYPIEIHKFFPEVQVYQQACPMWVSLIENEEQDSKGAGYFIKKYIDELMQKAPLIDTMLLACTHYPLLMEKIAQYMPKDVRIISQGELVALSLKDYLQRHPELENLCSKNQGRTFLTTGDPRQFEEKALAFLGQELSAERVELG